MSFRTLIKCFGVVLVTYLLLCLAATTSVSRPTLLKSTYDWRLNGVSSSGWTQSRFSFREDRFLSFGSILELKFETVRPSEAGSAKISFRYDGSEIYNVQITKEPVTFTSFSLNTISLSASCNNPFNPELGSDRSLCTKLYSIEIKPRFLTLVISPLFIAPLLTLTVLLSFIFSYSIKRSFVSLFGILPIFSISGILAFSPLDHWERSYWLIAFFILLQFGYLISRNLQLSSITTNDKKYYYPLFCTLIFIFALWLRISAVQFGLPHLYHPDESRKIKVAGQILQTGDLDPNYFRHPSFIPYSTALLGKIKSIFTGDIPKYYELLYLGRSVSATFGAATVFVIFALGSLLYSQQVGLFAAALLAVTPLHVVCSRYLKEDSDLLFFLLLSIYFVCRYIRTPKTSLLLLAGIFGGIASSIKYSGALSGAFIVIPYGLAIIQRDLKLARQHILPTTISLLCIIVFFLAVTPYAVLNSPKFLKDLFYEGAHMARGHTGAISAGAYYWTFHLSHSIIPAFTSPVSILALCSLGFLLWRRRQEDLFIFLTIMIFYLPAEYVKAKPFPQPERYILPCIPFLCIALSAFLMALKDKYRYTSFFPLVLLIFPTWYSVSHRSAALYDTRGIASEWILNNISDKSFIVSDWTFYSPYLPRNKFNVVELKAPQGRDILASLSLKTLKDLKVDYFITSSLFYDRFIRQVKRGYKSSLGYQEIFDTLKPVAVFSNPRYAYGFHNPTIVIFKIPKEP